MERRGKVVLLRQPCPQRSKGDSVLTEASMLEAAKGTAVKSKVCTDEQLKAS